MRNTSLFAASFVEADDDYGGDTWAGVVDFLPCPRAPEESITTLAMA
jgi:hypothetical protein